MSLSLTQKTGKAKLVGRREVDAKEKGLQDLLTFGVSPLLEI